MKLHGEITINGRRYTKGSEVPWQTIYPFFLLHMLAFGGSGFFMAYAADHIPLFGIYAHGGIAILVYTGFYLIIFGRDEVKWMFINAALGCLGIYTQIDWILSLFGKTISDYPFYLHVIPFLYFILYTFLLRQAVLDLFRARDNEVRKNLVEYGYIILSVLFYVVLT
jgi:hypothetical protein